jgi:HKD family nuclease
MDSIKDVSTTLEVLNSFLLSTKNSSKILKELFEMPQKTKSIDFLVEYKKRTENATKVLDDLLNNNKRVRDYIYSEILGKTILSE